MHGVSLLTLLSIVAFHYFLLLIATATYPQIFTFHLGFSPFLLLIPIEVFLFLYNLLFIEKLKDFFRAVSRPLLILHGVFFVITWSSWISLSIIESLNYDNFVFSEYHIHLESLGTLASYSVIVQLCLYLLLFKKSLFSRLAKNRKLLSLDNIQVLSLYLAILIFSFSTLLSTKNTLLDLVERNVFVVSHLNWSYNQKMNHVWSDFFSYMQLITDITPTSAVIATPPADSHWLSTGNSVLVRYFLHPRKIVDCDVIDCMPPSSANYIFLAKGFWADSEVPYGWPKQPIQSSRVHYFNLDTMTVNTVYSEYDPLLPVHQESWGIIQR